MGPYHWISNVFYGTDMFQLDVGYCSPIQSNELKYTKINRNNLFK